MSYGNKPKLSFKEVITALYLGEKVRIDYWGDNEFIYRDTPSMSILDQSNQEVNAVTIVNNYYSSFWELFDHTDDKLAHIKLLVSKQ